MPGLACAVHQPNFFPRLSTLAKLYAADVWVILDDVQFSRRDYQHRCYLPAAGPALPARWLTVPVHLPDGRATLIRDARIADPVLTARRLRGLLRQYFRKSHRRSAVWDLLAEAEDAVGSCASVAEASERTTIALLEAVGWRGRICRSSGIAARTGRSERLADLTMSVGATAYLCGTGGSRYLDPAPFTAQGLEVQYFMPPSRLASLPPDACQRATALADLAEAGPRALTRHLDSHAAAWWSSSRVIPQPGPQDWLGRSEQEQHPAETWHLPEDRTGRARDRSSGPVDQDLPRCREAGPHRNRPPDHAAPAHNALHDCLIAQAIGLI